mmetsp:Transcript_538/g.840  ORF Transcript_538/g.840 Transcript_538/m.840 type:complete len:229 (+) Transcript_538:137-823(+)
MCTIRDKRSWNYSCLTDGIVSFGIREDSFVFQTLNKILVNRPRSGFERLVHVHNHNIPKRLPLQEESPRIHQVQQLLHIRLRIFQDRIDNMSRKRRLKNPVLVHCHRLHQATRAQALNSTKPTIARVLRAAEWKRLVHVVGPELVDTDDTSLNPVNIFFRSLAVVHEHSGTQAQFAIVDHPQTLIIIGKLIQACNRSKNFLLRNPHVWCYIGEERWLVEKAVRSEFQL